MREVASVCPGCGRRSYVSVDAWAGSPDSVRDGRCGACGGGDRVDWPVLSDQPRPGRGVRSSVGPLILAVALVAAPLVAAFEIALR